jgi:hypothetical protein
VKNLVPRSALALGVIFACGIHGEGRPTSTAIVVKRIISDAPKATRIAVTDAARLFVLTPDDHAVAVHDLSGAPLGRVGMVGNGAGELLNPVDLAPAPGGGLWVVDKGNHRLQRFDKDGRVNAQIPVPSPLSAAVTGSGDVLVVAAFDRPLMRVYDKTGSQVREIGEPVKLNGMPPEQEAYLSRGRVFAFDGGALYMFRSLAAPKILRLDPKGQVTREIAVESKILEAAKQRALQTQEEVKKSGGYRYSGTLNGAAVETGANVIWICPSAPALLAYSLSAGSELAEFEMRLDDPSGEKVALQDIVVRGKTAFGVVAKRGIVKFELPTLSKSTR